MKKLVKVAAGLLLALGVLYILRSAGLPFSDELGAAIATIFRLMAALASWGAGLFGGQ
ncbi:hypothetical protein GCM10012275_63490 [Longimycelium tulufanense]|uniref:Uncharacterized protein n=1 Tax=Longimycelium tulufanense TaxID=907463 RepID=A0A8J3CEQ6_9PSEU|nr:hypothetical protein [Longimycelium tulufanense]GGM84145.1 hypothetical protein GCM10012275_63490 [Longimycelium tulufanense]